MVKLLIYTFIYKEHLFLGTKNRGPGLQECFSFEQFTVSTIKLVKFKF
jgi:hypothetical protein